MELQKFNIKGSAKFVSAELQLYNDEFLELQGWVIGKEVTEEEFMYALDDLRLSLSTEGNLFARVSLKAVDMAERIGGYSSFMISKKHPMYKTVMDILESASIDLEGIEGLTLNKNTHSTLFVTLMRLLVKSYREYIRGVC